MNFNSFNFDRQINANISKLGYDVPTSIQNQTIPAILEGKDVMGLAHTGTGKTAAFGLPIIQHLLDKPSNSRSVRVLIIAPTRELASQIVDAFDDFGKGTGLRSVAVYGGIGIQGQIAKLRRGCEIVVACPGRLLDHLNRGTIDLSQVEIMVLDEADQMFDMGFLPAIRKIVKRVSRQRQTLLFSATMPDDIKTLARDLLGEPVTVQVGTATPVETVSHAIYPVNSQNKTKLLMKILEDIESGSVLVFTKTKLRAKRLTEELENKGHKTTSLHGNLSQPKRQLALNGFRNGAFQILVATDIAARGIDVSGISHVINYDMPNTPEAYTHRIGRTGRACRNGDAFTFVTLQDKQMVRAIERLLKKPIESRIVKGFDYKSPRIMAPDNRTKEGSKAGSRTRPSRSPKAKQPRRYSRSRLNNSRSSDRARGPRQEGGSAYVQ